MINHLLFATVLAVAAVGCRETPAAECGATIYRSRAAARAVILDDARLDAVYARAEDLRPLRSLLVFQGDSLRRERYFSGARAEQPANIKSASKTIISALVGMALARGQLRDVRQPLSELLPAETRGLDSMRRAITLEDLLTMRTGLRSTSFDMYGEFVSSRNWVSHALTRPVVASRGEGAPMIYSTGSTHLLSAVLTRATKQTTWAFARRSLTPLGIRLRHWTTDPQGVYFGGNEMRMTPREMLAFGRMYLDGGRAPDGTQVLPRAWIDSSWVPRTTSNWSGNAYGYGWWIRESHGHRVYFAWGYGGQFIFVVPSASIVVVITSDPESARRDGEHLGAVHGMVDELLAPGDQETGVGFNTSAVHDVARQMIPLRNTLSACHDLIPPPGPDSCAGATTSPASRTHGGGGGSTGGILMITDFDDWSASARGTLCPPSWPAGRGSRQATPWETGSWPHRSD